MKKVNLFTTLYSIRDFIRMQHGIKRIKVSLSSQVWALRLSGDRLVPAKGQNDY